MKKGIRILITLLLAIPIASFGNDSKLKELIHKMREMCPIVLNEAMTLDEVKYDGNVVTMNYIFQEGFLDFDGIRANQEAVRYNLLVGYANSTEEGFKTLIDAIIEAEADLCVIYNSKGVEKIEMHFSAKELKANRPTDNSDPEKYLKSLADNDRLETPYVFDTGMIVIDVILDAHYYIDVIECDESLYDMDVIKEYSSLLKKEWVDGIHGQNDQVTKNMCKLLKNTNRGLARKYIGSSSRKTIMICIEPDEL